MKYLTKVEITEKDFAELHHITTENSVWKILETGILPGNQLKGCGRKHVHSTPLDSFDHPPKANRRAMQNIKTRPSSALGVRREAYAFKQGQANDMVSICYDTAVARKEGSNFFQVPSVTVLSEHGITPSSFLYAINVQTRAIVWKADAPTATEAER
jgi:hypothetical protein